MPSQSTVLQGMLKWWQSTWNRTLSAWLSRVQSQEDYAIASQHLRKNEKKQQRVTFNNQTFINQTPQQL